MNGSDISWPETGLHLHGLGLAHISNLIYSIEVIASARVLLLGGFLRLFLLLILDPCEIGGLLRHREILAAKLLVLVYNTVADGSGRRRLERVELVLTYLKGHRGTVHALVCTHLGVRCRRHLGYIELRIDRVASSLFTILRGVEVDRNLRDCLWLLVLLRVFLARGAHETLAVVGSLLHYTLRIKINRGKVLRVHNLLSLLYVVLLVRKNWLEVNLLSLRMRHLGLHLVLHMELNFLRVGSSWVGLGMS